ncbi:carbohydrate kinase [Kaistia sp. 32K]|uniref:FGGY-family carbohydrate kinase n=1 Tax=Kaistia sp. 32K TaxID=2795690 RepID=UPI001916B2D8|nr:FGGY family carbohydrate kinase [Kaistia sp. 32K]BCP54698.1 carbohydrate kinase [Kaistia sp. 32K]
MSQAIAVLDIGKSNAKLALLDRETRAVLDIRTRKNAVLPGPPYPHFDVDGIWEWFLDGLADFSTRAEIRVIATTTHGASIVVLGRDDLALPVLDYEFAGPDEIAGEYRKARGDFAEILSPDMPGGLNAGRQLYWMSRRFPEAFAQAEAILPYPQYWVWRLSGRRVGEVTSFGAHSDLWNGRAGDYSSLAETEGWTRLFPPRAAAWETVGTILPEIARRTGLPADCRVVAGIHDSNASLLPHILSRPLPFTVISTGTWMITFAAGGSLDHLDTTRGGLAYADAFARPVPSAMSMAGREFQILTEGEAAEPDAAAIRAVIDGRVMALPGFVPGNGPFGRRTGSWTVDPAVLSPAERTAAASLYVALVAEACLRLTGSEGPVLIEGPFARNGLFLSALAALVDRPVIGRPDATGTTEGAALLADGPDRPRAASPDPAPAAPLGDDFAGYAALWRRLSES